MLVPGSGNQTESDLDTANTDLNSDPIHNKVKQLLKATAKCRSRFTLIDECYIIELFLFLFCPLDNLSVFLFKTNCLKYLSY